MLTLLAVVRLMNPPTPVNSFSVCMACTYQHICRVSCVKRQTVEGNQGHLFQDRAAQPGEPRGHCRCGGSRGLLPEVADRAPGESHAFRALRLLRNSLCVFACLFVCSPSLGHMFVGLCLGYNIIYYIYIFVFWGGRGGSDLSLPSENAKYQTLERQGKGAPCVLLCTWTRARWLLRMRYPVGDFPAALRDSAIQASERK